MMTSAGYIERLRYQSVNLRAKVSKEKDLGRQRFLLGELIGVSYALECAQLAPNARPSHQQRRRELACRRAGMRRHYLAVLAHYLATASSPGAARPASPDATTSARV